MNPRANKLAIAFIMLIFNSLCYGEPVNTATEVTTRATVELAVEQETTPTTKEESARQKKPVRAIYIANTTTQVTDSSFLTGSITVDVELRIGKLEKQENAIIGHYEVRVDMSDIPAALRVLAGSKNEEGTISLPTEETFNELLTEGGKLEGVGYCPDKGESRKIVCTILPLPKNAKSGSVKMMIDSGKRVMHFDSRYSTTLPITLPVSDPAIKPAKDAANKR